MKNQDKIRLFNILIRFEGKKVAKAKNQQIEDKNENINIMKKNGIINSFIVFLFDLSPTQKQIKLLQSMETLLNSVRNNLASPQKNNSDPIPQDAKKSHTPSSLHTTKRELCVRNCYFYENRCSETLIFVT